MDGNILKWRHKKFTTYKSGAYRCCIRGQSILVGANMRWGGGIDTRSKACLLIALFAASLVFDCAGPATRNNSLSFQDGQGLSNEQILLRNIVEAAHDKTPTFVAASGVTSGATFDASLAASFSIPDTGHSISPTLRGNRQQSVSILDYGATKAAQHLYAPVNHGLARQLLLQGWPSELIETVLCAAIVIHPDLNDLISQKAQDACNRAPTEGVREICEWTEEMIRRCGNPIGPQSGFLNDAQRECSFVRFQIIISRLAITGTEFRVREVSVKDEKGKPVLDDNDQPVIHEEFQEVFSDPEINDLFDQLNARRTDDDPYVLAVFLRSPAQIIEFLGRLAALQLYRDRTTVPAVPLPARNGLEWLVPLRVVRGSDLNGTSAVSVRVNGERYHVPQPYPLSVYRDQSVRVMSLVIELQNRARREAPVQGAAIAILQ